MLPHRLQLRVQAAGSGLLLHEQILLCGTCLPQACHLRNHPQRAASHLRLPGLLAVIFATDFEAPPEPWQDFKGRNGLCHQILLGFVFGWIKINMNVLF
jgi:hypothetical protein